MTYEWECRACGNIEAIQRPMADRDVPPDKVCSCVEAGLNSAKEAKWLRYISVPNFTRRTFLDGMRKDKNWVDAKQALNLEKQKAASNSESEKKEMSKEISKLRTLK